MRQAHLLPLVVLIEMLEYLISKKAIVHIITENIMILFDQVNY